MPHYDFECQTCRHAFEVTASVAEYTAMRRERRITCPACGATQVMRVFSAPNLSSTSPASHQGGGCCCPGGQCR